MIASVRQARLGLTLCFSSLHAERLRKNQRQALLASAVLKKESRKVKEKGSHEAPPPKSAFA
jgi:hypothetical protein